jgi:hypothetical protein
MPEIICTKIISVGLMNTTTRIVDLIKAFRVYSINRTWRPLPSYIDYVRAVADSPRDRRRVIFGFSDPSVVFTKLMLHKPRSYRPEMLRPLRTADACEGQGFLDQ